MCWDLTEQIVVAAPKAGAGQKQPSPFTYTFTKFVSVHPLCSFSDRNCRYSFGVVVAAAVAVVVAAACFLFDWIFIYLLERIFEKDTKQQPFFEATTLPMVQDLLDGYNSLLFTYGVTNSGKTFTVLVTPTLTSYFSSKNLHFSSNCTTDTHIYLVSE